MGSKPCPRSMWEKKAVAGVHGSAPFSVRLDFDGSQHHTVEADLDQAGVDAIRCNELAHATERNTGVPCARPDYRVEPLRGGRKRMDGRFPGAVLRGSMGSVRANAMLNVARSCLQCSEIQPFGTAHRLAPAVPLLPSKTEWSIAARRSGRPRARHTRNHP